MTPDHYFQWRSMLVGALLCLSMASQAQTRSVEFYTFEASGLDYGPTEKEFRAAALAFGPNTLVSIDPRINEVQVLATAPFNLGDFLEMAQQHGVILNLKPTEGLPDDQ